MSTMALPTRLRLREIMLAAVSLALMVVVASLAVALVSLQKQATSVRPTVVAPATIHHDAAKTPVRTDAPKKLELSGEAPQPPVGVPVVTTPAWQRLEVP